MRLIPPAVHRMLDLATVVAFAVAPAALGLSGFPATLAYLLAVVHLAMTLLTRGASHPRRPVPLWMHGAVECAVGVALIAIPWLLHWQGTPRTFYVAAGSVIVVVWALSRERVPTAQASA